MEEVENLDIRDVERFGMDQDQITLTGFHNVRKLIAKEFQTGELRKSKGYFVSANSGVKLTFRCQSSHVHQRNPNKNPTKTRLVELLVELILIFSRFKSERSLVKVSILFDLDTGIV